MYPFDPPPPPTQVGLTNLIKNKTCITWNNKSTIDLIVTNKPRCFQYTNTFELGVNDCHKLIVTCMKSTVARLKPRNIRY